jgi:beta-galactosidase
MLTIFGSQFLLDGKPYRILSGAMHYFRVVPDYWRDRLAKLAAFGLNTVETYVAWNLHEPHPGKFHFDNGLDIVKYVEMAAEAGLNVILRPGPYICSEWDFGGLPSWLLKDPQMQVRCTYPPYLEAVDRYFDELLPRLTPLLDSNGGPIIAMQVENEYGSFGNDLAYLAHLVDGMRSRGVDVLLFTSDSPRDECLQGGTLPGILATVNFAFDAAKAFAKLHEYRPDDPLMVTEFWSGWFDHWGEQHHIIEDGSDSIDRSVQTLDEILAAGASLNFYMFHGGSNFGFMNGANLAVNGYQADITSYDYAAPLDEAGEPGPRFAAYQKVLNRYLDLPTTITVSPVIKRAFGVVEMSESAGLFESLSALSEMQLSVTPDPMEMFDQDFGFILYRTHISGARPVSCLHVRDLRDRALVFINGQLHATLEREKGVEFDTFAVPAAGLTLDLLVENMGRVNFGTGLLDRKGILGGVILADQFLFGWEIYTLPLKDLDALSFRALAGREQAGPIFYRTTFEVATPADTFLALPGWTKGVAWINRINLGRYWARGPQKTLYLPAPLLNCGINELIVFELHGTERFAVEFRDTPDLG